MRMPSLPRTLSSLFSNTAGTPSTSSSQWLSNAATALTHSEQHQQSQPNHYHYQQSQSSNSSRDLPTIKKPRMSRAQSYLAVAIPSTPYSESPPSSNAFQLKGDDDDLKLPSPSTADGSAHNANSTGLAARPISSHLLSRARSGSASMPSIHVPTHLHPRHSLSNLLPPILFLCIVFSISLVCIYFAISTIPLTIPHNISQIKEQTIALRDYSRQGMAEGLHVSAVLSALFVFKQAFSVPGSILVNILFGSLYGTYAATVCACLFTGVGSVGAYYMAKLCAPLVERFFPKALQTTKSTLLGGTRSDLFSYLLLARLFPLLPYSALNIACGVLKVPVQPFFITLVLGSFPYNFVTTQLGDLLGNLASTVGGSDEGTGINAIWTWDLCFKLAVASILSAAPLLFKKQLKSFLGGSDAKMMPSGSNSESADIPLAGLSRSGAMASRPNLSRYDTLEREAQQSNTERPAARPCIPLLRRDRTDSSASEVLAGSPVSAGHKKSWSFSWDTLKHSLAQHSKDSSSSSETASNSADSIFSPTMDYPRRSIDGTSTSNSTTVDDGESGDTDEEQLREERARRSRQNSRQNSADFDKASLKAHDHVQRRTASIESTAGLNYFDNAPRRKSGNYSPEWDRF